MCLNGEATIGSDDKRWDVGQPNNQNEDQSCAEVLVYPASGTSAAWHDRECHA